MTSGKETPSLFDADLTQDPGFIIHADMSLRHKTAAEALGIVLSEDISTWYDAADNELQSLMEDRFARPITMLDARETRSALNERVDAFRTDSELLGRHTVVVALDPAFVDVAKTDYVFQETRASLVGPGTPVIDLEHNPRGYINRFSTYRSGNNGAGKSLEQQVQEVADLVRSQGSATDVAVVEDYANSGRSLIERFGHFTGNQDTTLTIITGTLNAQAAKRFADGGVLASALHTFEETPAKYMDATDLLPTLGGRVIGWSRMISAGEQSAPKPRVAGAPGDHILMAVDAITGDYPWQVDLHAPDMTPEFSADIRRLSLNTAYGFWRSLERSAGHELEWKDLRPLNGLVKVFYPMRDKQSVRQNSKKNMASGPRAAIERIMEETI